MSKQYTPRPNSIADRMLRTVNVLSTYDTARNITDRANHHNTGKHIKDSQSSQALFTLYKGNCILRKKLPGKKISYVYAPKEMRVTNEITETNKPPEASSNEALVKKFVDNVIHKNHELRDIIQDHMLDTSLTYLMNEAKLTETDIQDLLK